MNILEKEIMLALKIKIFQTQTEKKQNIWKIKVKEKILLSHLINSVEELKNVCLDK